MALSLVDGSDHWRSDGPSRFRSKQTDNSIYQGAWNLRTLLRGCVKLEEAGHWEQPLSRALWVCASQCPWSKQLCSTVCALSYHALPKHSPIVAGPNDHGLKPQKQRMKVLALSKGSLKYLLWGTWARCICPLGPYSSVLPEYAREQQK